MNAPLLEVRNVFRDFKISGGALSATRMLRAVRGVSFNVAEGDVLGLVGESGCGKSTLAKLLIGMLAPSSGDVLFEGRSLASYGHQAITRSVQPIFQDPYSSLNPRKTIGSIIGLPLEVHDVGDRTDRRRRVLEIMDRVGLPARFYPSYPDQLSGGQRQRVAIARALIMKPKLVVCDEPTSALDVSVQSQILNLLLELKRDLNLTYILISHNLAVVEHLATRVAVMYMGRIVEEAPTETLFSTPRHPYTLALLASVLTPDPNAGLPALNIGTAFPNPFSPPSGCTFHPRCPQIKPLCGSAVPGRSTFEESFVECHLYEQRGHAEIALDL